MSREYELEFETEGELELEGEFEYEGELEGEFESEEFLSRLARLAARGLQSPTMRRLSGAAARSVLRGGLGDVGGLLPRSLGGRLGSLLGPAAGLGPDDGDSEFEFEDEALINPVRRVYPAAVMAHLGHAASQARSEAEAEAFLGALVPLAARLIPRIAPTVMRVAPRLIRGVVGVGRTLLRSPTARSLIRAVPDIVQGTVSDMANQASQGQPISAQSAVRTLACRTHRTLSSPQRSLRAIRRGRALDRRYHDSLRRIHCR